MANVNKKYILAIESAISGGSIALLAGDDFVSGFSSGNSISRAEDLLPRIVDLLGEAGVKRDEIGRVAISLGPGSYTGLRIGIATVLGLCRGLGIDYVGVPIFEGIANYYDDVPSVIALPMGRSDICVAETASGVTRVISLDVLKSEITKWPSSRLLVHSDLVRDLKEIRPDVVDIGTNLARAIGAAAFDRPKSTALEPIYIQNPRFA